MDPALNLSFRPFGSIKQAFCTDENRTVGFFAVVCICMDLDGFVRVDVLEEPFELNGFRQIFELLGDSADQESF